mmetsp:Transcript_101501/g.262376  ORF Transcript_101501/g.262376 Transcript_101501/m.262376 type:complete len:287 (+) Transcript_101501:1358-2218(+)
MSRSRSARSEVNALCLSLSIWLCDLVFRLSTVTRAISLCRFCVSTSFSMISSRIFLMRFLLLLATRSEVVCSLVSSSILPIKSVMSRETFWMFRSCTSMLWLWSEIWALSLVVSSTCPSMVFFNMLKDSMSFSRSCLMVVIWELRYCISLSLRSRSESTCSCRSCSRLIALFRPRISLSIASSASAWSASAFCTFPSASSRRAWPTMEDRHCCSNCFFSNSMASISLEASRSVVIAASVSCFCATSCASKRAFCSVIRLTSSFMLSIRRSCLCFVFSTCLMWSSAL